MRAADGAVLASAAGLGLAVASGGGFEAFQRVVVVLVVLLAMIAGAACWRRPTGAEEVLPAVVIAWGAVAAMLHPAAPLAAKETLGAWLVAWLLWLGARRASGAGVGAIRTTLMVVALLAALAAIGEAWGRGGPRVGGLLENPNLTAALLVTMLPWCPRLGRWPGVATAVLLTAGVVVTGSRAGLLAVVVAAALAVPDRRRRWVVVGAAAAVAAAAVVLRLVTQPDALAWHRLAIWRAVVQLAAGHPLVGVAPGGLVDAAGVVRLPHPELVGRHQFVISFAESTPLGLLVQLGVPGFALAAAAVAWWLSRGRGRRLLDAPASRGLLAAMATVACFHDLLQVPVVLWWWALQIGLEEAGLEERANPPAVEAGRALPRIAVALCVGWTLAWSLGQPAVAELRWRRGPATTDTVDAVMLLEPLEDDPLLWRVGDLLGRGDRWSWQQAGEALARGRRAVRVHPGRARGWASLGRVHARTARDLGMFPATLDAGRLAFRRATDLDPFVPWVWLDWAKLERSAGEVGRARELVLRALESEPATVEAWLLLGRLELDQGRIEAARAALDEALGVRRRMRHRVLNRYERDLVTAPQWQLRQLQGALR